MSVRELIEQYRAGPKLLHQVLAGMSRERLLARPIPGKWSTLEVVCHLSDFELVYADRMKRVVVEHEPKLLNGNPDLFAAGLAYDHREMAEELTLIETIRGQMARILRTLEKEDFQRRGVHSTDGPLTLQTLLERATQHIPHHVRFIEQKRRAMSIR